MEKFIGLDLGTTTLGIATSDTLGFVHGLETFRFPAEAYSQARKRVHEIVLQTGIKHIVIGLPINMDGSEGSRALSSKKFLEDLSSEDPSLIIDLQDERMTSISAHKTLYEMNVKGKDHKKSVDRLAACEILDFYLETKGK